MPYIKKQTSLVKNFIKNGYAIFDVENMTSLNYIKKICQDEALKILNKKK